MVKINYAELRFDHIVVFSHEDTTFACCKENGHGRTRLFLVFGSTVGRVYTRNGLTESWEILNDYEAETIRKLIQRATNQGITIYKFNGSSEVVTGQVITAD